MANATITAEAHEAHDDHGHMETNTGISNNKMAMWLFLGSDCLPVSYTHLTLPTTSRV